ncbi:hypothetical protein M2162_001791 [Streptomyces sp. SAI-041]|nr:hypothetical protein [Streptomyces sp. SAI-041]
MTSPTTRAVRAPGSFHRVEPVAADPAEERARQIAGGDVAARHARRDVRQHAVLERLGDGLLEGVHARVVEHEARAGGEFGAGDPVHVVELDALGVPQQDHEPEDHVAGLQGYDEHGAAGDQRPDVPLLELRGDRVPHLFADARHEDGLAAGHALEERGVRGERHGLADRHHVVPAARFVGVLQGHPVPHGGGVRHAVGEPLAGDDLFAQIGAGHVGEAGHDGFADLDDGAGQVEGGADLPADLVEELQPLAHGDVLEVLALVRFVLRQRQAGRDRPGRPLPAGPALGAPGHAPVGGDGHPVVLAELQDRIAQFEDLRDDAGAFADAHAGQDLGEPAGEFLGAGEVGVQGEGGRDPLDGRTALVQVEVPLESAGVGGQHQQALPAGTHQRVGPPQDVDAVRAGHGEAGAACGRVGETAVEGGLEVGSESVVDRVDAVGRGVRLVGEGSGDGQQVGGGAADGLLLAGAEQPARAPAPVRDQAVAVHDHHGQRDPAGRGVSVRRAVAGSAAGRCAPLGATVHGPGPLSARSVPPAPPYGAGPSRCAAMRELARPRSPRRAPPR